MFNNRARHLGGVLRTVKDDVQDTVWEAGGFENGANGPEAAWGHFRAFEDAGVAGGKGVRYGAEAEDIRSIPKSHVKD